jgi:hypothetical protein
VNARKLVTIAAAATLAITPMVANAAASLSVARAMAPTSGVSYLQDEDGDNTGGGSTAVIIGVLLIVLLGAIAVSGGDEPANSP